ncbi:hypothetical protein FRB98_002958 [Tulasnella sp. 332]|nr:hypothetical protein FRB98_002958 [Tulasnella sp. 332]
MMSSFRLEAPISSRSEEKAHLAIIDETLQHLVHTKDLAMPLAILSPSEPILDHVTSLRLLGTGEESPILLPILRASPNLKSLEIEASPLESGSADESPAFLRDLGTIGLSTFRHEFPTALLVKLRQSNRIRTLKLSCIACGVRNGGQDMIKIVQEVPWMSQLTNLSLVCINISEITLVPMLRRLPAVTCLRLTRQRMTGSRLFKAFSKSGTSRRPRLCPRLKELHLKDCCEMGREDIKAMIVGRARDMSGEIKSSVAGSKGGVLVRLEKLVWKGRDMVKQVLADN